MSFFRFLNSLAPCNRISVLASTIFKSSNQSASNLVANIIRNEQFKADDLSLDDVMALFKTLDCNGTPIYDRTQSKETFNVDFNNTGLKEDIDGILMTVYMSIIREYSKVFYLIQKKGSADADLLVELLVHSDVFKRIYNACCSVKEYDQEKRKPDSRSHRYFNTTDDFTFDSDANETKVDHIELQPVSSAQLHALGVELMKRGQLVKAVKILLVALSQLDSSLTSERLSILKNLVSLAGEKYEYKLLVDYFPTIEHQVNVFITTELHKPEIERSSGPQWADDLMVMLNLSIECHRFCSQMININQVMTY